MPQRKRRREELLPLWSYVLGHEMWWICSTLIDNPRAIASNQSVYPFNDALRDGLGRI